MIKKILIANRGEIACRIIKSARKLGIYTVAVYSEADRNALHVQMADEAFLLGPPPSSQSYLLGDKILEIAFKSGADAIHPGYGFLSENADFADKVKAAGLIFIGPSGDAMRKMGAKIGAKEIAGKANVPLVPGTEGAIQDVEAAKAFAVQIGFPVLVKASAGGGGKGMRIVEREADFAEQVERAMSEALSSFGDGSVFIEKYIGKPKHIEIQVLADQHGKAVYLFERECSIQRRHQKLVEEAPSASVSPELRAQMGQSAVMLCHACQYEGAGTVEFLLDENGNYYFLEMNTRLQVEHPVTEYITGLDLVEWQIKIAQGEPITFEQSDLKINGHALELRLCAEDPLNNFLPATGRLEKYRLQTSDDIRLDTGFLEGDEIPVYYDSMIAKLIVHAPTREAAIQKLTKAIDQFELDGIPNTLQFGKFAVNHPAFKDASFDTNFIKYYYSPEIMQDQEKENATIAGLIAVKIYEKAIQEVHPPKALSSMWSRRSVR
jgi:acetyl-CoA carboxylase biotin carboxylase subunit